MAKAAAFIPEATVQCALRQEQCPRNIEQIGQWRLQRIEIGSDMSCVAGFVQCAQQIETFGEL